MKDQILKYIQHEFEIENLQTVKITHYSYCKFPEDTCVCRDLKKISYDTQLMNGGYIDSFSMTTIIIFLENTFNVKIPDAEINPMNFNTVNSMVDLVKKYQNNVNN